ncbi:metalloprotease TldD [Rhodovastum atsumiense]|uniref:Metalloprotease TldD n=1 Tax=Rhodovastum atsumiense TaxID=504468 RepID=A0A5M6IM45_9PROT|nr:metalloprotease TldD [Rhodovastum atsumiense]KAA5608929.1 metalloprotease TldD [Rhodovastum atsumiense]CAH2604217.1 metalloprotease TldD [Rhodovastum atsumiense]
MTADAISLDTPLAVTDRLFFEREGATLDRDTAGRMVAQAMAGRDDGELFLEYEETESISLDDGRIRSAGFDTTLGFGLRAVAGEATGYAHSGELSEDALKRAAATVAAVAAGHSGTAAEAPRASNARLYSDANPLSSMDFGQRTTLLSELDAYARGRDPRVKQVMASVSGSWQAVQIIRADGRRVADLRPLVRMNVSVVVEQNGRRETGSFGCGGRFGYDRVLGAEAWRAAVDEALRQALVNLDSVPAPAGEMEVVLGPGWPGILLHEAIGHGLEGDFNRKKTSAFAGLLGQRIAAPGVTVVDDGTLPDRRGSLTVDDEGTPTSRTVLIEDGYLREFMQDRLNARLMGVRATGNGRRQSYAHAPMPRMTNTIMLSGPHTPEEMIRSVKRGLYAVNFGGGQVDITSGKFVFSASEAYLIEDGKVTTPVKGATLIGNGPDSLTKVEMIGNDMALDPGIGTCGKNGQGVPVGVGQPTLKLKGLTVGGTAA